MCLECRFLFFPFLNPEQVVCPEQVQLGGDPGVCESIDGFVDQWQWGPVLDSYGVKASVVHASAE